MNVFEEKDKEIFEKYCKRYSMNHIPPILKFPERVIAIGDIHGDIQMLRTLLIKSKVIDSKDNWICENTYVVQVGDQVDDSRSKEISGIFETKDTDVLTYTNTLHLKSLQHKSMFISLIGNHEILNVLSLNNDINKTKSFLNYVSEKSISAFATTNDKDSGYINRAKLFFPGNVIAKLLACTRLPVVIIGKYIFMHGGITNNTLKHLNINGKNKLFEIQFIIRKFLLGLTNDKSEKQIVKKILMSDIFWSRILSTIPDNLSLNDERCESQISDVLRTLNLNGIIIGHTSNKLRMTCNNKIIHLNSMNSKAFDIFNNSKFLIEKPTALQINKNDTMEIIS